MIKDREITLLLHGYGPIKAKIVGLTEELASSKLMGAWWTDSALDPTETNAEIDRFWDWNAVQIQYPQDQPLASEKVAVITGHGSDLAIQGATMISAEPIDSIAEPQKQCCLLELLFTAPRNRPKLRADKRQWVVGVGSELLIWAAWYSREKGCDGRLRLDASPDFVNWYEKKGLLKLDVDSTVYEDVAYTPMELSAEKAQDLLAAWDEDR